MAGAKALLAFVRSFIDPYSSRRLLDNSSNTCRASSRTEILGHTKLPESPDRASFPTPDRPPQATFSARPTQWNLRSFPKPAPPSAASAAPPEVLEAGDCEAAAAATLLRRAVCVHGRLGCVRI